MRLAILLVVLGGCVIPTRLGHYAVIVCAELKADAYVDDDAGEP